MKKIFSFISVIILAMMSSYVYASKNTVRNQECNNASNDDGLFSCPINMEQKLADLKNEVDLKKCKCSYEKRFTFFEENIDVLKKVAKENYVYALMSANAYDKGFQVEIPGWERTNRLISKHGFSADIYISDNHKNVVIAYRGTDDLKDWTYANLDTDGEGQYLDADNVFKKVVKKYSDLKIMTVGHSLGGGLAIHVSVTHKDIDAVVFNPSPRVFVSKDDIKYTNKVTIIYETGEILTAIRAMFTTLNKIDHTEYKYNYLGGHSISEHSMPNFASCMYASTIEEEVHYASKCKDNTWWNQK